jgi:hypothetical protein
VALAHALHLSIGVPYTAITTPTSWLMLEPFDLLAACTALFAVDAVARHLGVPLVRRAVLTVAEVAVLWDVVIWQWHPEDAFAVALALWGLLAAFGGRWRRCGWLLGAGIAFQPLVVLALAAVVAKVPRRALTAVMARAVAPAAVLLAGPLVANPRGTLHALLDQPNSIAVGHPTHPTPWVHLAPHLGGGVVAAGPARLVAVVVAVVVSWMVCRRTGRDEVVVWAVALAFATRSLFEAVMVAYYLWPALAVALIVAARTTRVRFAAACVLSSFATSFALLGWRGEWPWWSVMVMCTAVILVAAWPREVAGAGLPVVGSDSRRVGLSL